jgi:hypothetical protein
MIHCSNSLATDELKMTDGYHAAHKRGTNTTRRGNGHYSPREPCSCIHASFKIITGAKRSVEGASQLDVCHHTADTSRSWTSSIVKAV